MIVVERIKPTDQDVVAWDNTLHGFGIRVKPSGVRSYIIQYRTLAQQKGCQANTWLAGRCQ